MCVYEFILSPPHFPLSLTPCVCVCVCVCLRRISGVGCLTTWKSKSNFAINTNFKFLCPIVNVGI